MQNLIVGMGDLKVGKSPTRIRTVLGSCIGLCLYEESFQVGGLLHFMLPSSIMDLNQDSIKRSKYADTGIEDLINSLKKEFTLTDFKFKAKLFGGAKILKKVSQDVGQHNLNAAKNILGNYKIPIIASKTGGEKGYQIDFDLGTGKVTCLISGGAKEEF